MAPSEDLFQLINSMTKSEKRHFTVFASRHVIGKENTYLKLFHAIEKQTHDGNWKEYNEDKIKKKFAGENFIKQLSVSKNYLYTLILNSLRFYHSGKTVDLELKKLQEQIIILFDRGLYEQSNKLIQKAKLIAERYEKNTDTIDLYNWELRIIKAQTNHKRLKVFSDNFFDKISTSIDMLKNEYQYQEKLAGVMILITNMLYSRSKSEIKQLKSHFESPLFKSENAAISFNAKTLFYNALSTYEHTIGDLKSSYINRKKNVNLWESHPERINESPRLYLSTIHQLLELQMDFKKYDEALIILNKIGKMKLKSKSELRSFFLLRTQFELWIYIESRQYEKALDLVDYIESGIKEFELESKLEWLVTIYFNITIMHFHLGRLKDAQKWLNKLYAVNQKGFMDQSFSLVKIISILIYYELGDESLLESAIKSTYRFLYQKNKLFPFEKSILDFIKTTQKITSRNKLIQEFKKLKEICINLSKDVNEKRVVDSIDFISWLESKIEKRPFKEILMEKSKRV